MIGYADSPIAQVRIGIVGLGNRGYTLLQMLAHDIEQGNCQITAICDLNADYVSRASTWLSSYQTGKAVEVVGNKDAWEALAKSDDVDLLLTLGRIFQRLQFWGKAKDYLSAAIALRPSAQGYSRLAAVLEHMGDQRSSAEAYRSGLSILLAE